ncbi:signal transduction histidine kinase/response regulator of citrate/malate metabolism [Nitrospina gracilis]|uniref:ATP-binding protein n=1 Tax=Nitrospina sp. Nb-3 TaxID=2940485 RepID=UPI001F1EF0CA|nr:ATP-binding protein [Nitrospina sp. Nb-3]MCF8723081.1 signal transduction histidine kinase/response regulator of citrate/malate metabolism [Nitrospina sp. Nb-3]
MSQEILEQIGELLDLQVQKLQSLASNPILVQHANASNKRFNSPDGNALIEEVSDSWNGRQLHPHIGRVLDNKASDLIFHFIRFPWRISGHRVFDSIIAINNQGVVFAGWPKPDKFVYSQEEWFQTRQNYGYLIKPEVSNGSNQVESLSVIVKTPFRLERRLGQEFGMLKAEIMVDELGQNLVRELRSHSYKNIEFLLTFGRDLVIGSGIKGPDGFQEVPAKRNLESIKSLEEKLETLQHGFEINLDNHVLRSYALQHLQNDFGDLRLVLTFDTDEILAPYYQLKKNILSAIGVAAVLLIVLCFILFRSITNPIQKLLTGVEAFRQGKWKKADFALDANNEMGELAHGFQGMADEISNYTANLEKMVDERTREYLEAKEHAEKANRAKSIFLSSMSHEIRTPLNAIMGYTQILKQDSQLDPVQREKISNIFRAGNHLLGLINDVLDISRIESGKHMLNEEEFNLANLVGDLTIMTKWKCDQKDLAFVVEFDETPESSLVTGDVNKLRQVLINLLGNAVKFTEKGRIVFRVKTRDQDRFYFEVSDTGVGISEDMKESIFEPFAQEEVGLKKGGTGLGLTISQRLVEILGGKLEMESRPGEGSKFHFTLTLPRVGEEESEKSTDSLELVKGLAPGVHVKALVVEDTDTCARVLSEILSGIGTDVKVVKSGRSALEILQSWKPDIIFLDYYMPELNGLDVFEKIMANPVLKGIKVVMATTAAFNHYHEKFFEKGVHDVIVKPLRREKVFDVLKRLLGVSFEFKTDEELAQNNPEFMPIDFEKIYIEESIFTQIDRSVRLGIVSEIEKNLTKMETLGSEAAKLAKKWRTLARKFNFKKIKEDFEKVSVVIGR